jgi:hypothetical protein
MFEFLKNLRSAREPTAALIRDAISRVDPLALAAVVSAASEERNRLLVEGTDGEIQTAEAVLAAAELALVRGKAVKEELERRLAVAEADEARAALDAELDRADAAAQKVADKLRSRLPKLAAEYVALLTELEAADRDVLAVNEKLGAAGRGDERIERPEWRARPRPVYQWEGAVSITATTVLPAIPELRCPGYGVLPPRAATFLRHSVSYEGERPKPLVIPSGPVFIPGA